MNNPADFRPLSADQIAALERQGCTSAAWDQVRATADFDPQCVRNVHFSGRVDLNRLRGSVRAADGSERPSELVDATLIDCQLGPDVRIAGVRVAVSNYLVEGGACLEDVGLVQAESGATFGNGLQIAAVNEGGGREVTLFPALSSQFAYLQALFRERPAFAQRLDEMSQQAARDAAARPATIGACAALQSVDRIVNVQIGPYAVIQGAAALENGTVLSEQQARTLVGPGVVARGFLIAEGSSVTDASQLADCYVGQGCRIGKQFSAENSLFFANCEAFHGEACSAFAGPYSVTHHKGTLLIAGCFSFYNAGSSTNQSNHMYKLGPLHEGKLERGCKTGSFSYLMWPCRIGPFSVVLGKHTRPVDTRDFPFSHLEATPDGRCEMTPGLYLSTVGTVRDGAKWPARDRRSGAVRRDRLDFAVFSPLTVGRMLRGMAKLSQLQEETPRSVRTVNVDGAEVRRVLLRTGIKYYRAGVEMYLLEQLVARLSAAGETGADWQAALQPSTAAIFSEQWVDLAGQLMPRGRLDALADDVEAGRLADVAALEVRLDQIRAAYAEDQWAWVAWAWSKAFDQPLTALTAEDVAAKKGQYREVRGKFLRLILADAEKEFAETARVGFGLGDEASRDADFTTVRGTYADDRFVQEMQAELARLVADG